jgi:hypothetical protein
MNTLLKFRYNPEYRADPRGPRRRLKLSREGRRG